MNRIIKILAIAFLSLAISFSACKKDDNKTTDVVKNYSGSGSRGDLITFAINQTDKTYSVNNETTGIDESGSYSIMNGALKGIYKINAMAQNFYAVELDDKIIAANFPTGQSENKISFGISSSINNVGKESQIAGDYIYIHFTNQSVNGAVENKEWGVVSVLASGALYIKPYATGGTGSLTSLSPENFNLSLPLTSGDMQGSWSVNGQDKVKLNIGIQGTQYTGFAYPSATSSVFMLDMGTGNGYILGLKISSSAVTLSQLAGLYKYVGVVADGSRLGGNALIKTDGTGTCAIESNGILSDNEYFTGITQCPNLPNVMYCNHFDPDYPSYQGKAYFIVAGDIIMYFIFNNQGDFNAYGAGAKI
jgi:hypothetical protein